MHGNQRSHRRCSIIATSAFFTLAVIAAQGVTPAAAGQRTAIPDQQITDHVDDELLADHAVRSHKIDVLTIDGIVTLKGTVNNILAKDRAARIAETVKGVRSVINRIEVAPSVVVTDVDIRKAIGNALLADPATEDWDIETEVKNGKITLTGTVESWPQKRLAARVAKGVRGVHAVENKIVVNDRANRTDKEIAIDIQESLRWDVRIDAGMVKVAVESGAVKLSGVVGSASEKRIAHMKSWVAGVRDVDISDLKVGRWARDDELRTDQFAKRTPDEIQDAITDALHHDPRVLRFKVAVEVLGSSVTLRGNVSNLKAKQAAGQIARRTVGVKTVFNRIKVRPVKLTKDQSIAKQIRDTFESNPYIDRFELSARVVNGVVYLAGEVDTYFEKALAKNLASGMRGVVSVQSRIKVDREIPYVPDPYVDESYSEIPYVYQPLRSPALTIVNDERIKKNIANEFYWSPFVDANEIKIEVDDGVATLTGKVRTRLEHDKAIENAWEGGPTRVVDRIEIE